mgnify:CR=1 FL=1
MNRNCIAILATLLAVSCGGAENPNLAVGELASDRHELTAETNEPIVRIAVAEGDELR